MTYSIKRVGIRSAAMAAFVCMIIIMIPFVPVLLLATAPMHFGVEETSGLWPERLFHTLFGLLLYGVFVALGASIVALVYNLSVRLHGGIKLEIELQDTQPAEKKKN